MTPNNTLSHLLNRVQRLIEEQGEDAPAAAFIFTNEDVFTWNEIAEDQVLVPREVAAKILNELEDYDYIYTKAFDLIEEELKSRNLITND
jgi:hypothetical protein